MCREIDEEMKQRLDNSHEFYEILYTHYFSFKEVSAINKKITYRMVNDWESKGFFESERITKKTGWRKYSILDLIRLLIIFDLRKFGFSSIKIKLIINDIFEFKTYETVGDTPYKSFHISHEVFNCVYNEKVFLIIRENGEIFYENEEFSAMHIVIPEQPILILPFFLYIKKIWEHLKINIQLKNKNSLLEIYQIAYSLTDKEKKLFKIIKDASYKTIQITKKDGHDIIVKATKSQYSANIKELLGIYTKKEYNKISVTQKDGKTFFITKEDHYKL